MSYDKEGPSLAEMRGRGNLYRQWFSRLSEETVTVRTNDGEILVKGLWTGTRFLCTRFTLISGTIVPEVDVLQRMANRERGLKEEALADMELSLSLRSNSGY
jgi:hypothetical protein